MNPWEMNLTVEDSTSVKPWEMGLAEDPATPPEPKKKSYVQGLAEYYTKDIPESVSGLGQRTLNRGKNIEAPTVLGNKAQQATGTTGLLGQLVNGTASIPERAVRTVGGAIGTIADVGGTAIELGGKAVNNISGKNIEKVTDPIVTEIAQKVGDTKTAQSIYKIWESLPPEEKANYKTAGDLFNAIGYSSGKTAAKATAKVGEKVGDAVENTGKNFLGGEMKIKKNLAEKGYGKTIDQKKKTMLNNIVKYDLQDSFGNFEKMAQRADDMASQKFNEVDNIVTQIASQPNSKKTNIDDILQDALDYADNSTALGKDQNAINIVSNIIDTANKRGLTGDQPIDVLIKFKRQLDPDGKLFARGPAPSNEDALDREIRKKIYLDTVKKINEVSKDAVYDVGKLNREGKELLDLAAIADDASSRIRNNKNLSLTDRLAALSSGVAAVTSYASGNPKASLLSLALGGAAIGANKALSQGRGASTIINIGKTIKAASDATRTAAPLIGYGTTGLLSNVKAKKY